MSRTTLLDRTSVLDATATRSCTNSEVTASRALFFIDVTTAASTAASWTITLQVLSPDGTIMALTDAEVIGVETVGVTQLTLATAFNTTAALNSLPIPFPDNILYTETSAGSSFTGDVFVIWS